MSQIDKQDAGAPATPVQTRTSNLRDRCGCAARREAIRAKLNAFYESVGMRTKVKAKETQGG